MKCREDKWRELWPPDVSLFFIWLHRSDKLRRIIRSRELAKADRHSEKARVQPGCFDLLQMVRFISNFHQIGLLSRIIDGLYLPKDV
jgi:hypothetical protein